MRTVNDLNLTISLRGGKQTEPSAVVYHNRYTDQRMWIGGKWWTLDQVTNWFNVLVKKEFKRMENC